MEKTTSIEITPEDVRGRSRATKLAATDPREALKAARAIKHPWYRCQALSNVAKHWGTQQQKLSLLEEALATAKQQQDTNRIVSVSSWPLEVMVNSQPDAAVTHLQRLIELAGHEMHSLRRADALYLIARAVCSRPPMLEAVVPALADALLHGHGWRIDRLIRSTLPLVPASMADLADRLIEHHSEGKQKRHLGSLKT